MNSDRYFIKILTIQGKMKKKILVTLMFCFLLTACGTSNKTNNTIAPTKYNNNENVIKETLVNGILFNATSFYYYNGYLVIEIYALTSLCDDFENIVISTANGISDDDRELFELVKKNSLTSLSVRKDSISNYVRPIEDNYITFDYAEVDDIDVIKNFSYDDYKKVINGIDFSYYSVFYRKKKQLFII